MFKIITIPFDRNMKGFNDELLNRFILNKDVKSYHVEFFESAEDKYWTVLVEYDIILEETAENEKQALSEAEKMLLKRLKEWRKERANKDGIPVFIIATNKELVDIIISAPGTLEALKGIKGFGKAKLSKYGKEIIEILNTFYSKT